MISPKQETVDAALGELGSAVRSRMWRGRHCLPPQSCLESPDDERHTRQASRREHHRSDRARARRSRRPLAGRQLRQGAGGVHQHRPDRSHERHDLRPRGARLHARLRHPAADQLRARRRVRALRPRREHGDRQRPRPRRGRERARHRRRPRVHARRDHGRVLAVQRLDRACRLQAAAPRAPRRRH